MANTPLEAKTILFAKNYPPFAKLFIVVIFLIGVGESFEVALMLDDGKELQNRNIQKAGLLAAEIFKVQLLHTGESWGEMPNQNYEGALKILELIGIVKAEGIDKIQQPLLPTKISC